MPRFRKLSAYPQIFWDMSRRALNNKDIFPIEITCDTPQAAQQLRVEFYGFRRALRASVEASSKSSDFISPDEAIAYEGACLISSPQIDYKATPCPLIFTLHEKRPALLAGTLQLEAALAAASGKSTSNDKGIRGRKATHVIIDDLAQEQAQAPEQELSISIPFKNNLYIIPLSDIPESKQSLSGTKLLTLVTNGLADLKKPLAFYKQEPSSTDGINRPADDKSRI